MKIPQFFRQPQLAPDIEDMAQARRSPGVAEPTFSAKAAAFFRGVVTAMRNTGASLSAATRSADTAMPRPQLPEISRNPFSIICGGRARADSDEGGFHLFHLNAPEINARSGLMEIGLAGSDDDSSWRDYEDGEHGSGLLDCGQTFQSTPEPFPGATYILPDFDEFDNRETPSGYGKADITGPEKREEGWRHYQRFLEDSGTHVSHAQYMAIKEILFDHDIHDFDLKPANEPSAPPDGFTLS